MWIRPVTDTRWEEMAELNSWPSHLREREREREIERTRALKQHSYLGSHFDARPEVYSELFWRGREHFPICFSRSSFNYIECIFERIEHTLLRQALGKNIRKIAKQPKNPIGCRQIMLTCMLFFAHAVIGPISSAHSWNCEWLCQFWVLSGAMCGIKAVHPLSQPIFILLSYQWLEIHKVTI